MADPISWINAGSQLLNAVGGAQAKPAAPGVATSGGAPIGLKADVDFSGWTVATGSGKADGATILKSQSDALGTDMQPMAQILGGLSPVTVIAGALALGLLWRAFKR